MIQAGERHQGAKQAGQEWTSFHENPANYGCSGNRNSCCIPYDYGI